MCKKKKKIVTKNTEQSAEDPEDPAEGTPLKIRVALPRPMYVKAGQYVNLWMPSVSFSSWLQFHPFMVTSWSPEKQDILELFVQTRCGLTEKLRARAALEGTASFTAFVSGPYGRSEPVDIAVAAEPLLNSLLDDDVLGNGYILEMSFYLEYKSKAEIFGEHHRAITYIGFPDYDSIISTEASGDLIDRVSNTQEERGKLLVLISAKDELRDHLTVIVRKYLDQGVKLCKVEFQPS
ncbi:rerric reductase like transmembrane component, putative [Aspergillus udagawae]|uniref:ferric-chelate reductase (NADPH) n=1 Tax=Aspergillus udagawae TaxID=91492 RepID=A0ABQ1BBQ8_9EURO|nr:rerric reductase like transmembrane component, putative [Aspergillus udagawae]